MLTRRAIESRIVQLQAQRALSYMASDTLPARTDLDDKTREELDHDCMIKVMHAEIALPLLIEQWGKVREDEVDDADPEDLLLRVVPLLRERQRDQGLASSIEEHGDILIRYAHVNAWAVVALDDWSPADRRPN